MHDSECEELAGYFLSEYKFSANERAQREDELAERIQQAVEDYMAEHSDFVYIQKGKW